MRWSAVFCLAELALANTGNGIRPRANSTDYPSRETAGGVTIAAAMISPDQVRKMFATDLDSGGYIVIELAIYPEAGTELDVLSGDFMMRIGTDSTVRPTNPSAIASILQKKNTPQPSRPNDINIYPSAGIGYERGRDPVTGARSRGVYTGTGVGVGVGVVDAPPVPPSASTDRDRMTMQQELEDKALPEGKATQAVAGYLYFPKASARTKKAAYELIYHGKDGQVKLLLPSPTNGPTRR